MVEGKRGKRLRGFRAARHHDQFLGREILFDQLAHRLAGGLGELARLDHGAVSGGENLRERAEAQIDRKIPRAEDADHAFRLVADLALRPHQIERKLDVALVGLRPFVEMLEAVFGEIHRADDIGDHRLLGRAIAEILAHRVAQDFGMIGQQRDHALDPVAPQSQRFGAGGGETRALGVEDRLQFGLGRHRLSPGNYVSPCNVCRAIVVPRQARHISAGKSAPICQCRNATLDRAQSDPHFERQSPHGPVFRP